jgi:hypothetical protein
MVNSPSKKQIEKEGEKEGGFCDELVGPWDSEVVKVIYDS